MLVDVCTGVLKVGGKDLAADDADAGQHLGFLGDENGPVFLGRLLAVDEHEPVVRGIHVRHEDEFIFEVVDDTGAVFKPLDEGDERRLFRFQVLEIELVPVGPFRGRKEEEALIFRYIHIMITARMGGVFVDQLVFGLGRPELVKIDLLVLVGRGQFLALSRFFKPGIVEPVTLPGGAAELGPLDAVLEQLAGFDLHDPYLGPIRPALGPRVGRIAVVIGEAAEKCSRGSVRGEGVGIEEDPRFAIEPFLDIDNGLVLEAVIFHEEVVFPDPEGGGIAGIIVDLGQASPDLLPERDLGQIIKGDLVLCFDPFRCRLGLIVLEPAVGIGDFGPKVVIHHVALRGYGISDRRLLSLAAERQQGGQEDQDQDEGLPFSHDFSFPCDHGAI